MISSFFAGENHYTLDFNAIKKVLQSEIEAANTRFISIPLAIEGHITHLLIEIRETNALIEFFDPFGKLIDHPDNRIGSTTLSEIATMARSILSKKMEKKIRSTFIDHQIQVQGDVH